MLGPDRPCEPWIVPTDLCCDLTNVAPASVASAILAATEYLYDRTCRRWPGECTATVRICLDCTCGWGGWSEWWGSPSSSWWMNGCRCRYRSTRLKAAFPIISVDQVRVDGVALAATDWRLDGHRDLVLQTPNSLGLAWWPIQNPNFPDDSVGTWAVDYTFGVAPLQIAKTAAADLACAILQACNLVEGECPLPEGSESVTKSGITIRFRSPADGITNVKTADLLINAYECPRPENRLIDPAEPLYIDRSP